MSSSVGTFLAFNHSNQAKGNMRAIELRLRRQAACAVAKTWLLLPMPSKAAKTAAACRRGCSSANPPPIAKAASAFTAPYRLL